MACKSKLSPEQCNLIGPFATCYMEMFSELSWHQWIQKTELAWALQTMKSLQAAFFFQVAYPLEKENKEVRGWIQLLVIAQCYEENNETIRLGDIILFYCLPKAQSNILLYFWKWHKESRGDLRRQYESVPWQFSHREETSARIIITE